MTEPFEMPLPGSRSASFPGWWSGSRQASSMRGAGSKPPAAPSLRTSFCSGGLRLPLRWSASLESAATSRGARHRVALRRAARRTRRVGLRCAAASACAFARPKFLLRLRLLPFGLLRHLRRPRAARRVESRCVELRGGRAASGCAARPRRRARSRDPIFSSGSGCFHLAFSPASAATSRGAPRRVALRRAARRRSRCHIGGPLRRVFLASAAFSLSSNCPLSPVLPRSGVQGNASTVLCPRRAVRPPPVRRSCCGVVVLLGK